jgi:predicted kinase
MDKQDILKNHYNVDQFIEMLGDRFPLLKEFKSTHQDKIWHAEGDVHIHTDMVLNETYDLIANQASYLSDDDKFCLIIGALFHDIAKPVVTMEVERHGRTCVIAPKHEIRGMGYMIHKIQSLNISKENIMKIMALIGYHQVPKMMVIRDKSKWDYYNLSQKAPLDLLYFLEVADMKGRISDDLQNHLEYLELFKLYAQDLDCFDKSNMPFISDNEYVQKKGFKALLNNVIHMPEEADAKFYNHKDNHGELVVMSGLSGVGKSSYIKAHYPEHTVVSLDELRGEIGKNRQDHSNEDKVLQKARLSLKTLLAKKQKVVYDSTNIRSDFRDKVLTIGHNYDALTRLVFLTDSIENIVKRDKERDHTVGENIIVKHQEGRFDYPEHDEADDYSIIFNTVKKR